MKKIIYMVICISGFIAMQAEVGCMDNSYHGDTSYGYDYKTYHYVNCYCPCTRYVNSIDRGYCLKCGHYRGILNH